MMLSTDYCHVLLTTVSTKIIQTSVQPNIIGPFSLFISASLMTLVKALKYCL